VDWTPGLSAGTTSTQRSIPRRSSQLDVFRYYNPYIRTISCPLLSRCLNDHDSSFETLGRGSLHRLHRSGPDVHITHEVKRDLVHKRVHIVPLTDDLVELPVLLLAFLPTVSPITTAGTDIKGATVVLRLLATRRTQVARVDRCEAEDGVWWGQDVLEYAGAVGCDDLEQFGAAVHFHVEGNRLVGREQQMFVGDVLQHVELFAELDEAFVAVVDWSSWFVGEVGFFELGEGERLQLPLRHRGSGILLVHLGEDCLCVEDHLFWQCTPFQKMLAIVSVVVVRKTSLVSVPSDMAQASSKLKS